jgi:hypothetical protein
MASAVHLDVCWRLDLARNHPADLGVDHFGSMVVEFGGQSASVSISGQEHFGFNDRRGG